MKLKAKNARQKIKWNLESKKTTTYNLLHKNDDIRQMRESYKQEFFETWKKGMENYLNGKWDIAWEIFKETKVRLTVFANPLAPRLCFLVLLMGLLKLLFLLSRGTMVRLLRTGKDSGL